METLFICIFGQRRLKEEMAFAYNPPEISGAEVAFFIRFFIGKKVTAKARLN